MKTKKHFYYDGIKIPHSKSETEFIYHKKENNGYLIKSQNNILQLYDIRKKEIVNTNVYSEFFFVKDNILFVFDGRKIYSCNLIKTKSGLNIVPDIVFNLSGKHLKHILDHEKNVKERVIKEKNIKTDFKLKPVNDEVYLIDKNSQKKISLN